MTLPRQRVTLITLRVADPDRARRFHAAWGWPPHPSDAEGVVFYRMAGAALALFPLDELAADQNRTDAAVTLAQNRADRAEVDAVFQAGLAAGASPLKPPQAVFWGVYSGYLAASDGTLTLP